MEKQYPSKMKYVGVFFLTGFISNILQRITDFFLAETFTNMNTYFISGSVAYFIITVGLFIFIYNFFSDLNIKKVMPYIIVLGGLGTLAAMGQVTILYSSLDLDIDLSVFYISTVVAFAAAIFSIRKYYVDNPERWF